MYVFNSNNSNDHYRSVDDLMKQFYLLNPLNGSDIKTINFCCIHVYAEKELWIDIKLSKWALP